MHTKYFYSITKLIIVSVALCSLTNGQISIVVSKSSTNTATQSELKQMFTGSLLSWSGGTKVAIIDQSDSETGKTFHSKFLDKSVAQVRGEWMKLVLSGQANAPKKCSDDEAVKKALSENPNSVGYITSSAMDGSVKELYRIN